MADDRSTEDPPDYRVYRSRPRLLGKRDGGGIAGLEGPRDGGLGPPGEPRRRRSRLRPGKVLGFIALACACLLYTSPSPRD